jgi:hypothetical protein
MSLNININEGADSDKGKEEEAMDDCSRSVGKCGELCWKVRFRSIQT